MTINPDLLARARQTGAELADADRQALLARAEHHTAIRRLHLAGASLREIAEALALSHQRIQQIVDGSGGSWWRRAWRTRGTTRDAVCTWCGRPPSEVGKLVAGPKIYICDACATGASRRLATAGNKEAGRGGMRTRCSFCRRSRSGGRRIVEGAHANVCDECLTLCREFMQLDATAS
jgi:hypothetical protein